MVFKSGKTELFSAVSFLGSIAINFVTVLLLYSLIHLSRVQTTKTILLMTLNVALIIGFASDLAQMNWYMFPLDYSILNMVDLTRKCFEMPNVSYTQPLEAEFT